MFKFAFISALFVCALGAANAQYATSTNTTIERYPYVVSILANGYYWCSGSLYSNTVVLTSALCFIEGIPAKDYTVRAGSTKWNTGGTSVSVATYVFHPKFDYYTYENNVAIVRLSTAFTLGSNIRPIALAPSAIAPGSDAIFTGWGLGYYGATTTANNILQQAFLKVISKLDCTSATYSYTLITNSMLCTTPIGRNSCLGDSGGPLSDGFYLHGFSSWDFKCNPGNYPGVFTNITAVRSWILETA